MKGLIYHADLRDQVGPVCPNILFAVPCKSSPNKSWLVISQVFFPLHRISNCVHLLFLKPMVPSPCAKQLRYTTELHVTKVTILTRTNKFFVNEWRWYICICPTSVKMSHAHPPIQASDVVLLVQWMPSNAICLQEISDIVYLNTKGNQSDLDANFVTCASLGVLALPREETYAILEADLREAGWPAPCI